MLFTDLVIAVFAFLGATVCGWLIYRVDRWQRLRFDVDTDQAMRVANSGRRP